MEGETGVVNLGVEKRLKENMRKVYEILKKARMAVRE